MTFATSKKSMNISYVTNPYNVADSKNRRGLMLHSEWNDKLFDIVRDKRITALYLNAAKGWSGADYSFLSRLPKLEELHILAKKPAVGLSSISKMKSLQELSLTCVSKEVVDFANLPRLEKVYLYWWEGADSILQCASLKKLYIDKSQLTSYNELINLKQLEKLTMANSKICSLDALQPLTQLMELELINCKKIEDFSPLSSLRKPSYHKWKQTPIFLTVYSIVE